MARPRILYISQWFEPEPTYKGLSFVKALQARGFDVDVLTGFPNFPSGHLYPGYPLRPVRRDVLDGVRVTRVPLFPSHDASGLRRSMNYLSFCASVTVYLLVRRRRYDAAYVYHPPITAAFAPAVAGLVRRLPFVVEVQDLWPEAVAHSGMAPDLATRTLGGIARIVYRRAARIVAQSRGIAARIVDRGAAPDRVRTVYNWAEESDLAGPGTTDLAPFGIENGRFTFVFAGNMGALQRLDRVLDAAFLAAERAPRIRLVLIGSGIEMDALRRRADADGRDIVRVLPGIPRTQIADLLQAADALVVHLAAEPIGEVTIPSKVQFYLASGKPILAGLSGEAAALIADADAGIVVAPEDVAGLADAMVALAGMDRDRRAQIGANGRRFYREHLSFANGMAEIEAVIRAAAAR